MSWALFGFLAFAGAAMRQLVKQVVQAGGRPARVGTLAVNWSGACLAGLFTGAEWYVAAGFLGALTTFSSFAAECATLVEEGRSLRAALYAIASISGGLLFYAAGLACYRAFV